MSISKYYYNKDYFETIDTEEKAYWLGFLFADGCINSYYRGEKLDSMNMELSLCREDEGHLYKFVDSIESNIEVKQRTNSYKGKEYLSSRINVCNTKFCYDLIDKGCISRKSSKVNFPKNIMEDNLIKDFIRGYFDGNGCIHTSTANNKPHIEISFSAGTSDMLKGISDFLLSKEIIRKIPKIYKDNRSNAYSVYFYGTDSVKEILDYLYKDSTIYLDRKFDAYTSFYLNYQPIMKRGVYWSEGNKAYIVSIYINGKKYRVGQSKNLDEAIKMRKDAEIKKMNMLEKPT